jgi:hypothetical protein
MVAADEGMLNKTDVDRGGVSTAMDQFNPRACIMPRDPSSCLWTQLLLQGCHKNVLQHVVRAAPQLWSKRQKNEQKGQ